MKREGRVKREGRDIKLGLHIADFTWAGGVPALGPALARHVRNADAAGITRITVVDHFWQNRVAGPPEHEMPEAYTTLGFLAAHTQTVHPHTLVTRRSRAELAAEPEGCAITGQGVDRAKTPSLDHSLSIRNKGMKCSGRVLYHVDYASVPQARHGK